MRILFASTAGAGHWAPMVPFARAAREAGHEVLVAAPRSFASAVEASGLEPAELGERRDEDATAMFSRIRGASFDEANAIMLRDGYGRLYPDAALPAMRDLVAGWRPHLVVRESLELASLLAALEHDVPTAEVTTVLMAFRPAIADIVMPSLAALAAERRLPVPSGGALADAPVLALTPPGFDPPADAARRYRTESPGERPSIARERRLVYVTFGSEAGRAGFFPWFYRAAIDGLTGRGWQVLLTIGRDADATALGTLPDDVRVERWVDQTSVLRQSAAIVFHGGYGTLIDVLAAGVPAVVLPLFSADQRANAARLAELGSGIALAGPGGMSELAAAVDRLLTDAHHGAAAGRLGDEVASLEGVSTAVGFLESLVP